MRRYRVDISCIIPHVIRAAAHTDVEVIREVERRAGEAFRGVGMDDVADDEVPGPDALIGFIRDGRAWVHEASSGVAGFILVRELAAACHVEQVSIDPAHRGRGIGAGLVGHAEIWAASRDLDALTLTTFADVPWNAPYYERLGFVRLAHSEVTSPLAEVLDEEVRRFPRYLRVAMRRAITR